MLEPERDGAEQIQAEEATEDDFGKRNVFKDEWEDSDVTFIVEEKKFHVHRQLLSLVSPTFKVMFTAEFLEKYQKVIPLPDKKASVFLTFLVIIYPQIGHEEISMENVGGLLALGDEYQVTKVIMECRKFLMSTALNNRLAMQILLLAQTYRLDNVRERCCNRLTSVVKTDELENLHGFQDLDARSLKRILLPQLKEFRSCLEDVLPQMVGLMEFGLILLKKQDSSFQCCSHYDTVLGKNTWFGSSSLIRTESRLRQCTECRDMFRRLKIPYLFFGQAQDLFRFDEKVTDVACKVMDLLGKK